MRCANPLTAHYGITHGLAIGIMLPHVIRFNAEHVHSQYSDLHSGGAEMLAGTAPVAPIGETRDKARRSRRQSQHLAGLGRGSVAAMDRPI